MKLLLCVYVSVLYTSISELWSSWIASIRWNFVQQNVNCQPAISTQCKLSTSYKHAHVNCQPAISMQLFNTVMCIKISSCYTNKHTHTHARVLTPPLPLPLPNSGAGHRYPLAAPTSARVCLMESLMHWESLLTYILFTKETLLLQPGQISHVAAAHNSPAQPYSVLENHILSFHISEPVTLIALLPPFFSSWHSSFPSLVFPCIHLHSTVRPSLNISRHSHPGLSPSNPPAGHISWSPPSSYHSISSSVTQLISFQCPVYTQEGTWVDDSPPLFAHVPAISTSSAWSLFPLSPGQLGIATQCSSFFPIMTLPEPPADTPWWRPAGVSNEGKRDPGLTPTKAEWLGQQP